MPRRRVRISTGAGELRTSGGERNPKKKPRPLKKATKREPVRWGGEKRETRPAGPKYTPATTADTPKAEKRIRQQKRVARAAAGPRRDNSLVALADFLKRNAPRAARAAGAESGEFVAQQMGLAASSDARKFARQTGAEVGEQAVYTPAGLVVAEEAARKDVSQAFRGDRSFKRSRKLGVEIAKSTAETVRHPARHPGYTLTLAAGAVGGGANVVSRVGSAGRALKAGKPIRQAVKKQPPGEIPIKVAGRTVGHVLEPDAAIPRAITRRKARITNEMLADPDRKPLGRAYEATIAPEHTAGRVMRSERTIKADLAAAPAETLRRASSELTPAEHAALRIYAIEGNHALRNPDEAVSRHAGAHARWADEDVEPDLNRTIAADTAKAAAVLRNPKAHPNFVRVAGLSRRTSRKSGREHQRRGHLTKEAEQSSRATIAQMYGHPGEGPPEGSFYFPTGEWFKPGGKVSQGKPSQPRPGQFGMGPPSQSLRGTSKQRTGEGVKRGVIEDVPGAIAENIVTRQRRYSAEDLYRLARAVGSPTKTREGQIGIRSTRKIRSEHRQLVRAEEAARQSGDATALARATQQLDDFKKGRAEPVVEGDIGAKIPGVRWVDKRMLKESEKVSSDHVVMKAATAISRPVRNFQVYFRPGYVATNLPANAIMGAYLHGPKVVREMKNARKMKKGDELTDLAEAAAGISRTESYGMGGLGPREKQIVGVITDITDRDFRLAMLRIRAAERGYKGDKGLKRLLTDPANEADKLAVSRRTRKDAVDFNSLTPAEKQVAEAAYFYPWISRGTAWAGRTAINRPVTTAALGQLAAQGKEQQPEWLKQGPRWLRGQIATKLGLVNPAGLWTPSTPVQTFESIRHPRTSYAAELGVPALEAAATEPEKIGGALFGSTAIGSGLRATGLVTDPRIVGKPPKTFPDETGGTAAGRFAFGALFPRKPDKEALRESALRDMPPQKAFAAKMTDLRKTFVEANRAQGVKGLAPELKEQMRLHSLRYGAYKRAGLSTSDDDYQHRAFALDLKSLGKIGQATPPQQREWIAWSKRKTNEEISSQREKWTREFFPTDWLNRAAKATGGSVPR